MRFHQPRWAWVWTRRGPKGQTVHDGLEWPPQLSEMPREAPRAPRRPWERVVAPDMPWERSARPRG
eukprot:8002022-Pyramimonas_sp.AAC.1